MSGLLLTVNRFKQVVVPQHEYGPLITLKNALVTLVPNSLPCHDRLPFKVMLRCACTAFGCLGEPNCRKLMPTLLIGLSTITTTENCMNRAYIFRFLKLPSTADNRVSYGCNFQRSKQVYGRQRRPIQMETPSPRNFVQ